MYPSPERCCFSRRASQPASSPRADVSAAGSRRRPVVAVPETPGPISIPAVRAAANLTHNPLAQEGRMPRFFLAVAVVLVAAAPAQAQQPAASKSSPSLDFEYFRTRVQPIFTT